MAPAELGDVVTFVYFTYCKILSECYVRVTASTSIQSTVFRSQGIYALQARNWLAFGVGVSFSNPGDMCACKAFGTPY